MSFEAILKNGGRFSVTDFIDRHQKILDEAKTPEERRAILTLMQSSLQDSVGIENLGLLAPPRGDTDNIIWRPGHVGGFAANFHVVNPRGAYPTNQLVRAYPALRYLRNLK
jgi:hypothetical protein